MTTKDEQSATLSKPPLKLDDVRSLADLHLEPGYTSIPPDRRAELVAEGHKEAGLLLEKWQKAGVPPEVLKEVMNSTGEWDREEKDFKPYLKPGDSPEKAADMLKDYNAVQNDWHKLFDISNTHAGTEYGLVKHQQIKDIYQQVSGQDPDKFYVPDYEGKNDWEKSQFKTYLSMNKDMLAVRREAVQECTDIVGRDANKAGVAVAKAVSTGRADLGTVAGYMVGWGAGAVGGLADKYMIHPFTADHDNASCAMDIKTDKPFVDSKPHVFIKEERPYADIQDTYAPLLGHRVNDQHNATDPTYLKFKYLEVTDSSQGGGHGLGGIGLSTSGKDTGLGK